MEHAAQDSLTSSWWECLRLWYNEAAYVDSMDLWFEAIDNFYNIHDGTNHLPTMMNAAAFETLRTARSSLRASSYDVSLARLLLFLAGCALDACRIHLARRLLTRSLFLMAASSDDERYEQTVDQILMEYIATFQEEAESPEEEVLSPQIAARELMEHARDSGCLPLRRTNPYYRAPILVPHYKMVGNPVCHERPLWCKALEDNYYVIRREILSLVSSPSLWPVVGSASHRDGAGFHDGTVVSSGSWREVVLFGSTGGTPHLAPRTSQLIEHHCYDEVVSLVEAGAGEVILSLLQPHTRIEPHTAQHNLRLTAHLGLVVPDPSAGACFIEVAGEKLHWQEGKMLIFDDAFEHSVVNETDHVRAVLLARFWHPSIPTGDRESAVEYVLQAKKDDRLRRFNPPIPNSSHLSRGMERDICDSCGHTGYDSIRLAGRQFVCVCGATIQ